MSVPQLRLDSASITVQRYDAVTLAGESFEATPQGGIRARGRFTRSGVLEYALPDGKVRREWRPPEEVFAPESYRTLCDATITVHHPEEGEVDAGTYRRETVGHVCGDVAPEAGEFLAGTCVIQDESAVRMARNKSLTEFSAGYLSVLDPTPGVVPDGMPDAGAPYDVIQRRIRYNHVAFLPPGTGRAGPEVSIRLDSRGNQIGPLTKDTKMELTPEELAALKALAALAPKLQALVAAPPVAAAATPVVTTDTTPEPQPVAVMEEEKEDTDTETDEPEKKTDSSKAKVKAQAPARVATQTQVKTDAKVFTPEEQERMVNDSIELRDQARKVLGDEYNFRGKSNQQVMIDVVRHVDSKFELGKRSSDYLLAKFEDALVQAPLIAQLQQQQHARVRANVHLDAADNKSPGSHLDNLHNRISNAWSGKKS